MILLELKIDTLHQRRFNGMKQTPHTTHGSLSAFMKTNLPQQLESSELGHILIDNPKQDETTIEQLNQLADNGSCCRFNKNSHRRNNISKALEVINST